MAGMLNSLKSVGTSTLLKLIMKVGLQQHGCSMRRRYNTPMPFSSVPELPMQETCQNFSVRAKPDLTSRKVANIVVAGDACGRQVLLNISRGFKLFTTSVTFQ